KRGGKRAKNKLLETVYTVREVRAAGEPLEPKEVRAKFRNHVGVVARTWIEPTWPDWRDVPPERKELLWTELSKVFQFPQGDVEKVKKHALKQLGVSYRKWKTDLTNRFLKNNLTPFDEFGKITPAQWDELKRQRTTEEAIKLSKANAALAKRDLHKPRLGPDLIAKGLPDPYEGLNDQTFQWVKGREVKVPGGQTRIAKPETQEVVERIRFWAEKEKEGKFISDRENDDLTKGLGTKEHGGRVRGVSSKVNWKEGFTEDRHKYKKHDRYKQKMRETAREFFMEEVKSMMSQGQFPTMAPTDLQIQLPSASTPVDNIKTPTPCELHIPLGIHGRTGKVANAVLTPGSSLFHGTPIPPEYARVEVVSVEAKHTEEMIDIPTPEGIHYLGQL
ncbi:hypothetical protein BS78_05G258600, partial [Paspalum vaginatum]